MKNYLWWRRKIPQSVVARKQMGGICCEHYRLSNNFQLNARMQYNVVHKSLHTTPMKEFRTIHLHFEQVAGPQTVLTGEAMANAVIQLQRVVYLLVKFNSGKKPKSSLNREEQARFALVCNEPPKKGSFALSLSIGEVGVDDEEISAVAHLFQMIAKSLNATSPKLMTKLLPNAEYCNAVLDSFRNASPPEASKLRFTVQSGGHRVLFSRKKFERTLAEVEKSLPGKEIERLEHVVTGTLRRVDFESRTMWLKPKGSRLLKVFYGEAEDAENLLLKNPRNLVHAYGMVTYDEKGPISIDKVDRVGEVDTAPIEISEIELAGKHYRACPPLLYQVEFCPRSYIYVIKGDFEITLAAESRIELETTLLDLLDIYWIDYAQGDPNRFTPSALELGEELRQRFKVL